MHTFSRAHFAPCFFGYTLYVLQCLKIADAGHKCALFITPESIFRKAFAADLLGIRKTQNLSSISN